MRRIAIAFIAFLIGLCLFGKGMARHDHDGGASECAACVFALHGRRDASAENPETWLSPNGLARTFGSQPSLGFQEQIQNAVLASAEPEATDNRVIHVDRGPVERLTEPITTTHFESGSPPRAPPA